MKHPQYQRHRKYGVEWLQAIFTLMVLGGVYLSMNHFDAYETRLTPSTPPVETNTQSYWNDSLGYGFHSDAGDIYTQRTTPTGDSVQVQSASGVVYQDTGVKVSFYRDATIDSIQRVHRENVPRTYSRLPNGIAVIEGDLASPKAKTILATLHTR